MINTTRQDRRNLALQSRVLSLDGRLLAQRTDKVNATANATTTLAPLHLAAPLSQFGLVLVVLTLDGPAGERISRNIYWQGREPRSQRQLNSLAPQKLTVRAHAVPQGTETVVSVELENRGTVPALAAKLTVVDAQGQRVLPALYSDNYVTVLPGESRRVDIRSSIEAAGIQIRGWNVVQATVTIQ